MTYSNSKWTVSVPATVNNITFYRCTPKGFGTDKAPGDGSAAGTGTVGWPTTEVQR